jgi:hypothetical protein
MTALSSFMHTQKIMETSIGVFGCQLKFFIVSIECVSEIFSAGDGIFTPTKPKCNAG